MFTNVRSYLPFIIVIVAALSLALFGFVTGLGDFSARQAEQALATATPEGLLPGVTPSPTRPSSPPLRQPQDGLTVALSGEMANGGYWRWDDIVNLLGVYGTAGQLVSREVEGTTYRGVPLAYLLRYARVNAEADRLLLSTRSGRQVMYVLRDAGDFADYLIAATPQNTLAVVPPYGRAFNVLQELTGIRAALAADVREVRAAPIPARPDELMLAGSVERGGLWSWADLTGLLEVYGSAGAYQTVTVASGTYSGVPVPYLLDYARVTRDRVNVVKLYTRDSTSYTAYSGLATSESYIIARAADGSLILVQPGGEPEVLHELAVIEVP